MYMFGAHVRDSGERFWVLSSIGERFWVLPSENTTFLSSAQDTLDREVSIFSNKSLKGNHRGQFWPPSCISLNLPKESYWLLLKTEHVWWSDGCLIWTKKALWGEGRESLQRRYELLHKYIFIRGNVNNAQPVPSLLLDRVGHLPQVAGLGYHERTAGCEFFFHLLLMQFYCEGHTLWERFWASDAKITWLWVMFPLTSVNVEKGAHFVVLLQQQNV